MFKDKILLITSGTGSFGNSVIKKVLNTGIKEIRIFSRDEKKQDDMRPVLEVCGHLPYSLKVGIGKTVQWLREMGEI